MFLSFVSAIVFPVLFFVRMSVVIAVIVVVSVIWLRVLSQAIKSQISPDSERNKTSARSEDR